MSFKVTVEDLDTGHVETAVVPLDNYILIPTGSCHLAGTQVHAGGTHVLTVKGVAITGGQST